MIVVDRPSILIEWDEAKELMRFEFRGFIDGQEYRGALDTALRVLIEKKATRLLWDLRRMKVLTTEDQKWAESDWTPRLVRDTKVRRSALILPASTIAQLALKRVRDKAAAVMQNEIVNESFDNVPDAEAWVMSDT